jgi:hypothetical protein
MPSYKNIELKPGQMFIWSYDGSFNLWVVLRKLPNGDGYEYKEFRGFKRLRKPSPCSCDKCSTFGRHDNLVNGTWYSPKKTKSEWEFTFVVSGSNVREIVRFKWFVYAKYKVCSWLTSNRPSYSDRF